MTISRAGAEIKGYLEELEDELYAASLAAGRKALVERLESLDDELAVQRERKEYRDKGKRRSILKTRLGEVVYERRVYERVNADGVKTYVYLLDVALGQDGTGYVSASLSRLVTAAACETSYRDAARQVWELTGMRLSHTGAWNIVQQTGEQARAAVSAQSKRAKTGAGRGSYESPILYEEMDGVWLALQGKDRAKYGPSREMKVSIAYAGVRLDGPKRRVLEKKVACAGFEPAREFLARKEGVIADTYNVDEVRLRVLNGDGGAWIRPAEDAIFQLDPFHRNKAIREYVDDPGLQETMRTLLAEGRVDDLLSCVEASIDSTLDPVQRENRRKLYSYFNYDRRALLPYDKRGIEIPPVNPGLLPAHGGSMESNVFTLIGNRMKGRRACWSLSGANRLAALLCLRHTKGLAKLPLSHADEPTQDGPAPTAFPVLSARQNPAKVGRGYNGFTHARIPGGLHWLNDLLQYAPFSQITLT